MENLNPTKKGFWDIIKGTLAGVDNEGSAKRATSFYTVIVLITGLDAVYIYAFWRSINKLCSDEICKIVMNMYEPVLDVHFLFVLVLLGLATIEMITNLIKTVKGQPVQ